MHFLLIAENFEGFDSRVIHVRRVFNMTGSVGRKRSMSALVVVGNGNGAIGKNLLHLNLFL